MTDTPINTLLKIPRGQLITKLSCYIFHELHYRTAIRGGLNNAGRIGCIFRNVDGVEIYLAQVINILKHEKRNMPLMMRLYVI